MGVGYGGQNLSRLCHGNFDSALIVDVNPFVTEIFMPIRNELTLRSANRAEYLSLLAGVRFNEDELRSLADASLEDIHKAVSNKIRGSSKEDRARNMAELWNEIGDMFPQEIKNEAKEFWDRYSPMYFGLGKMVERMKKTDAEGRGSWLANEQNFSKIKSMVKDGRIWGVTGDILSEGINGAIEQELADQGLNISVLYLSNLMEWTGRSLKNVDVDHDMLLIVNNLGVTSVKNIKGITGNIAFGFTPEEEAVLRGQIETESGSVRDNNQDIVSVAAERANSLVLREENIRSALEERGVSAGEIDSVIKALKELDFKWFEARVDGEERYLLGHENALAVNVIRHLIAEETAAGIGNLIDEYLLHEALERTGLEHYEIVQITNRTFARGDFVRPGQTPLGRALRKFINRESSEKAVDNFLRSGEKRFIRALVELREGSGKEAVRIFLVENDPEVRKEHVRKYIKIGGNRSLFNSLQEELNAVAEKEMEGLGQEDMDAEKALMSEKVDVFFENMLDVLENDSLVDISRVQIKTSEEVLAIERVAGSLAAESKGGAEVIASRIRPLAANARNIAYGLNRSELEEGLRNARGREDTVLMDDIYLFSLALEFRALYDTKTASVVKPDDVSTTGIPALEFSNDEIGFMGSINLAASQGVVTDDVINGIADIISDGGKGTLYITPDIAAGYLDSAGFLNGSAEVLKNAVKQKLLQKSSDRIEKNKQSALRDVKNVLKIGDRSVYDIDDITGSLLLLEIISSDISAESLNFLKENRGKSLLNSLRGIEGAEMIGADLEEKGSYEKAVEVYMKGLMELEVLLKALDEVRTDPNTLKDIERYILYKKIALIGSRKKAVEKDTELKNAAVDEAEGFIYKGFSEDEAESYVEEMRIDTASVGEDIVSTVKERVGQILKNKERLAVMLRERDVPRNQIDSVLAALESIDFEWFKAKVEEEERYILGRENAVAVDVVRHLLGSEGVGGEKDLVDEYLLHEALERTRLEHYEIIALTTEFFKRGEFSRPRNTPLGQALRGFINTEATKAALSGMPALIRRELYRLNMETKDVSYTLSIINKIADIYSSMGEDEGIDLTYERYHNHLHNLTVTLATLMLMPRMAAARDQKIALLASLFHDFHERAVTKDDGITGTPAYVKETLLQFRDILGLKDYKNPAKGESGEEKYARYDRSSEDITKLRTLISDLIGEGNKEEMFDEIAAMIARTDFASNVAPPSDGSYKQKAAAVRKDIIDARIGSLKRDIEDKDISDMIASVNNEYAKIGKDAWLERQRNIEVDYLEQLKKVKQSRRRAVHRYAFLLEKGADQSSAYWMMTPGVVENIVKGLGQEIVASDWGSYMFFFKPELLNDEVLEVLSGLPLEYRENFVNVVEHFARLATEKAYTGAVPENVTELISTSRNDWEEIKNDVRRKLRLRAQPIVLVDAEGVETVLMEAAQKIPGTDVGEILSVNDLKTIFLAAEELGDVLEMNDTVIENARGIMGIILRDARAAGSINEDEIIKPLTQVRIVKADLNDTIEALGYMDNGTLIIVMNDNGGRAADYLADGEALASLAAHEFLEADGYLSHGDLKYFEMIYNKGSAMTPLNRVAIKHMTLRQLIDIEPKHPADSDGTFYNAAQAEIVIRASGKEISIAMGNKLANEILQEEKDRKGVSDATVPGRTTASQLVIEEMVSEGGTVVEIGIGGFNAPTFRELKTALEERNVTVRGIEYVSENIPRDLAGDIVQGNIFNIGSDEDVTALIRQADVIRVSNLIIPYFDKKQKKQVLLSMEKDMKPGARLIISHSPSLTQIKFPGEEGFVYEKTDKGLELKNFIYSVTVSVETHDIHYIGNKDYSVFSGKNGLEESLVFGPLRSDEEFFEFSGEFFDKMSDDKVYENEINMKISEVIAEGLRAEGYKAEVIGEMISLDLASGKVPKNMMGIMRGIMPQLEPVSADMSTSVSSEKQLEMEEASDRISREMLDAVNKAGGDSGLSEDLDPAAMKRAALEFLAEADKNILSEIKIGTYPSIVLLEVSEDQLLFDGSKYTKLKNDTGRTVVRKYGINAAVIFYSNTEESIKGIEAAVKGVNGFNEPKSRVIAFCGSETEGALRDTLTGEEFEGKVSGFVKGDFVSGDNNERLSLVSLTILGLGLMDLNRAYEAGKKAEDLETSIKVLLSGLMDNYSDMEEYIAKECNND
ncbi:MAG: hypothetical protein ABH862_03890, partial [Candidatus Omnitrophota bacterium]